MKAIYKTIGFAFLAVCFLASCDKDDDYSTSTPVIQSAEITPTTFAFGDSVRLTAKLADAQTRLATLNVRITADNRTIAEQVIQVGGNEQDIDLPVFVPLVDNLSEGSRVKIELSLKNVLKGEATQEIAGLTGNRPYFNQLYLVTDDGKVYPLVQESYAKDNYTAADLALNRSFSYKIAQKVSGTEIDYSGLVWGSKNGKIALIDERGESIFAFAMGADYIESFTYNSLGFNVFLSGDKYSDNDFALSGFAEETIDGEVFRTLRRTLEENQEITLFSDLADDLIVYNPDFFDRLSKNKVRFLGETGEYTIYYNTYRKHVLIGVDNSSYPDYLLITGGGIGYPTKVPGIDKEHCWWGFGNVRNFLLFRKIEDNVFAGTMAFHPKDDSWVSFKPYENNGWGGEKRFDQMTLVGDKLLESSDGNNWYPSSEMDPNAFYRIIINWATNTMEVEKVTL
ncbi:hypothetical protein FACS189416_3260 [Bacteroidia bacterium]|nr:hypothetical protein FACS189416_3260 [Bacteroidia bacterium]